MLVDRVIPSRMPHLAILALAFLFAPTAWVQAACTAGNPNANLVESTPTADFNTSAIDGTVIHTKTSLMWKRCAEGQTWDGATCTGGASNLNWQNALAAAANSTFAGYSDWRLPNVKELQSIVETCGFNPAINQTVFPATPLSSFWSASSYGPNPAAYAWVVSFIEAPGGLVFADAKIGGGRARLVRGGQSFNSFDLLLGAVRVSKTVAGAAAASVPAATTFPVTLTCGATTLGPLNATTATPAMFTNVPLGNCTVAEGTLPTVAGVTWGTPTFNPSATVTVTAGATTAVTVTNTANVTTYAITVTANPTAGGTVSCTPNPVDHGGTSNCTATPNAGYTFANWSGDCTGSGDCTLGNVTAPKTVTANFTVTAAKTFTGPTATGTGNATATVTGGGDTCGFARSQFVALASVPATPPSGYTFPHGLFDFALAYCDGTVTVTITYPTAAGTVYWKFGPTPDNASPHWYSMPGATVAGNIATFIITDGGWGDDDLTINRSIVDQGGPGVPGGGAAAANNIPTLSEWAMLLLIGLLGYSGWRLRRRAF